MFQTYSAIFRTIDRSRHVFPNSRYISADSGISRILALLDVFMYIEEYSEP